MSTGHPGPTRGATNARVFSINTVGPSTRGFRICRFNQPRRTTAVSRSRPRGWLNPVVPVPSVGQGAVTRGSPTVEVALLTRLVAQESQRPPTEIHFFTVLVAGSPRLRWQQIWLGRGLSFGLGHSHFGAHVAFPPRRRGGGRPLVSLPGGTLTLSGQDLRRI